MLRNSCPAAYHLKGHKEERLVESLLSVGCWQLGGGRVQRADACPTDNQVMLLQREGEGYSRNCTVRSQSHLEIGHWWSDQRHLDCFMYSLSFVVKEIVFPVIMCGCESCTIEKAWVPKNWCFWSVVLEKILESPIDCRDIKPVNPKGNQPWRFIERTDAEVEAIILG